MVNAVPVQPFGAAAAVAVSGAHVCDVVPDVFEHAAAPHTASIAPRIRVMDSRVIRVSLVDKSKKRAAKNS
jgi:hypothetical protein